MNGEQIDDIVIESQQNSLTLKKYRTCDRNYLTRKELFYENTNIPYSLTKNLRDQMIQMCSSFF